MEAVDRGGDAARELGGKGIAAIESGAHRRAPPVEHEEP
jgi:hypothetical protein